MRLPTFVAWPALTLLVATLFWQASVSATSEKGVDEVEIRQHMKDQGPGAVKDFGDSLALVNKDSQNHPQVQFEESLATTWEDLDGGWRQGRNRPLLRQ